ncbi:MAG: gliding motility-associated C-terminal domain-containing protein [Bacteroidota bacterium]|nr:gliding motility-associated C-terminal domain-containing protein [Bacteroidota bacterium]
MQYIKYGLLFFICVGTVKYANGTHIRAGEILSRKISTLEYEFTLILYRNTSGVKLDTASIYFGDGTKAEKSFDESVVLNSNTEKYTFRFKKTYGAPGKYNVFTVVPNRNSGIVNMNNSGSLTFYVETEIIIDPLLGSNTSPVLLAPPIDKGNKNQLFTHNPAAFDTDGDSLVFELTSPKWFDEDTAEVVPGYKNPSTYNAPPLCVNSKFDLDPKTGQITWDKPCIPGLYNIAFVVREFRKGVQIGFLTRDMQIEIIDQNNNVPELKVPSDTCITSGTQLKGTITGIDKDLDKINLYAFSGILSLAGTGASVSLQFGSNPQNTPANMFFSWNTSCANVRGQPYEIVFKAEDVPPTGLVPLVAVKPWMIKVIGPKLVNLKAISQNKTMKLSWNKYSCSNASKIVIMRKDCPSKSENIDSCVTAPELGTSYTHVATVNASDTTYIDTGGQVGLKRGALYCYMAYAIFPEPAKGNGRPSDEVCAYLSLDVPVMANVTVDSTSKNKGQITVRWTKPKAIDSLVFPPPYYYSLWRINGVNPIVYKSVTTLAGLNDTTFKDTGLNTDDEIYNYYLRFNYGPNATLKEVTDTASMVKLTGISKQKRVALIWNYDVPWNNSNKYHFIFRQSNDSTFLIDSVFANGYSVTYTDLGNYKNQRLKNGVKYTYFVKTVGAYTCPDGVSKVKLPFRLENFSQKVSIIPSDTNKPCPPTLKIVTPECNQPVQNTKIYWKPSYSITCDSLIKNYNIYFGKSSSESNLIASITDTFYIHSNAASEIGCYFVTAVSKESNTESGPSNSVCNQKLDCVYYYELPNTFTPNNDNVNDKFVANTLPQFITSCKVEIYNRWGMKIYETTSPKIEWDGSGMVDGVYYYSAKIQFTNNQSDEKKGWVQLLR